jgi:hypothetical protein
MINGSRSIWIDYQMRLRISAASGSERRFHSERTRYESGADSFELLPFNFSNERSLVRGGFERDREIELWNIATMAGIKFRLR